MKKEMLIGAVVCVLGAVAAGIAVFARTRKGR